VKIVNKSACGVNVESSANYGQAIVGNCKITHSDKELGGGVEVNVSSAGAAGDTNAKLTFDKLIPSGKLSVSGNAQPSMNVEATYAKDFFAGTLKFGTNFAGKKGIDASGAIGYDNVAVGGAVSMCCSGTVKDFNVGAEWSEKDVTASLITSNKGEDITTSFFQKISNGFSVGTKLTIESEGARTLCVGSDYALDSNTLWKNSLDSKGIVNVAVSHTLANPACKINVAGQFDALSSDILKANKMGVGISLGDF